MSVRTGRILHFYNSNHSVSASKKIFLPFFLFTLLFVFPLLSVFTQKIVHAQVEVFEYSYDQGTNGVGRLSSVIEKKGSTETGRTTFFYDERGNVTGTDRLLPGAPVYSIRSEFDSLDRQKNLTYPDGEKIQNTYNNQGLLESVISTNRSNPNYVTNFNYNVLGQVTSKALGSSKTTTYNYHPQNFRLSGLSTTGLQNLNYEYDEVGNIKRIIDGVGPGTQNFVYDPLHRLTFAYSAASPPYRHSYAYTEIGTRPSTISIETVETLPDSANITGIDLRLELVLDRNGNPHIVYTLFHPGGVIAPTIRYAKRTESGWEVEPVPVPCNVQRGGTLPSLALDANGNPHIIFINIGTEGCNTVGPGSAMIYAHKSGGSWTSEIIRVWSPKTNEWLDGAGRWSGTIAVDANGTPHIAWDCTAHVKVICYAKRVNGEWVGVNRWAYNPDPLEGTPDRDPRHVMNGDPGSIRLRLDGAGNPHIVTQNLYIRWVGYNAGSPDWHNGWEFETFPNSLFAMGGEGRASSFVLDDTGTPHVLMMSGTNPKYYYGRKSGNSWVTEQTPNAGHGLDLDPAADPHVTTGFYIDGTFNAASYHWHYGRRVGSDWVYHDITADGVNFYLPVFNQSIKTDSSGNPHMAAYTFSINNNVHSDPIRITYAKVVPLQSVEYPSDGSLRPHAPLTEKRSDGTGSEIYNYTYDANGNMETRTTGGIIRTFTWDFQNQLKRVTQNGNTLAEFTYDYTGLRSTKVKPLPNQTNQTTHYIGDLYECIINTSTPCTKYIFAGGERIASRPVGSDAVQYYHSDHLKSTNVVTNSTGTSLQTLYYFPFGETRVNSIAPSTGERYKFTDQELDEETGLYYYGARYYDPSLGIFISPDIIEPNRANPQTLNRYAYALNNPLKYNDPSGRNAETAVDPQQLSPPVFEAIRNFFIVTIPRLTQTVVGALLAPETIIAVGIVGLTAETLDDPGDIPSTHFSKVNKLGPDPDAVGPHSTFKTNPSGKVTGYTEFDAEGNAVKRFRGEGRPHGGQDPPLILEPKAGKGPGSPLKVPRPPRLEELPKGYP